MLTLECLSDGWILHHENQLHKMHFSFSDKWNMSKLSNILIIHYLCSLSQHANSNSKKVILRNVTLRSSGSYRCEISAEEPDFKTVQGEGQLTVVCKYLRKHFIQKFLKFLSRRIECLKFKRSQVDTQAAFNGL